MQKIETRVTKYNKRGFVSKFWLFLKDPEYIDDLEKQLNDAVDQFHVRLEHWLLPFENFLPV